MTRAAGLVWTACLAVATCVGLPVATAGASTVTARPVRSYVPVGPAVHGSSSPAGAPRLEPGQYTDSLRADQQKNYTITLADGVTPYLAVTLIRPTGVVREAGSDYASFTDYVSIGILTAAGSDCGSVDESKSQGRSVSAFSAVALPGRVGNGWTGDFSGSSDGNCGKPGKYVISVSRKQSSKTVPNSELPIEIVYIAEPPLADDVTTLPGQRPVSTASLAPDVTATAMPVKGGGGHSKAAELPKSGGYQDTIKPGETLYYRIRLGQGQRLGYTVRFHGQKSLDKFLPVEAFLVTPYREPAMDSESSGSYSSSTDETVTGALSAPVAYRNRESDADTVAQLQLAGYYYLVINMANPDKPTQAEVSINIAVTVAGAPTDEPKYRKVAGTSNTDDWGLPGQEPPGVSVRKLAYLSGGGLALLAALLVLLVPALRRRS